MWAIEDISLFDLPVVWKFYVRSLFSVAAAVPKNKSIISCFSS
jgi:hypothetical protein